MERILPIYRVPTTKQHRDLIVLNPYDPADIPKPGARFAPNIDPHTLASATIISMIRFYNEDYGIVDGDTIEKRRHKVANWLTQTAQAWSLTCVQCNVYLSCQHERFSQRN